MEMNVIGYNNLLVQPPDHFRDFMLYDWKDLTEKANTLIKQAEAHAVVNGMDKIYNTKVREAQSCLLGADLLIGRVFSGLTPMA
jgi:hypothetical protein